MNTVCDIGTEALQTEFPYLVNNLLTLSPGIGERDWGLIRGFDMMDKGGGELKNRAVYAVCPVYYKRRSLQ